IKARSLITAGIPGGLSIKSIGIGIGGINPVIRLVALTSCGDGGNLRFGAGAGAFFPTVADRTENQSSQDDDDRYDDKQLDEAERGCSGRRVACDWKNFA